MFFFSSETLLELIIAKDALKISSPSIDQILLNEFFKEFAPSFDQLYSESLAPTKINFDLPSRDAITKATQKTEQRLKDEQKLVIRRNASKDEKFYSIFSLSTG